MTVVSVVGARPQFVKLKPMSDALAAAGLDHQIVHTGQHYDSDMSEAFFHGLELAEPLVNLGVGSGSHATQTASVMVRLEPILREADPAWVLVYGDTNSTIGAALTAAKLRIRVAHIEAGLRSGNRDMPEEINRILADHSSDLLMAPTQLAMRNLRDEGLASRAHLTGDVMADVLVKATAELAAQGRDEDGDYVVATIHRASNTDDSVQLKNLVSALSRLQIPVKLVAHPRLLAAAANAGLDLAVGALEVLAPLPYLDMLRLMVHSRGVVTDSGGLQKEAFLLGVPCTTLRGETEWPETLVGGMNVLDPQGKRLEEIVQREVKPPDEQPYGDGQASVRIVKLLQTNVNER